MHSTLRKYQSCARQGPIAANDPMQSHNAILWLRFWSASSSLSKDFRSLIIVSFYCPLNHHTSVDIIPLWDSCWTSNPGSIYYSNVTLWHDRVTISTATRSSTTSSATLRSWQTKILIIACYHYFSTRKRSGFGSNSLTCTTSSSLANLANSRVSIFLLATINAFYYK